MLLEDITRLLICQLQLALAPDVTRHLTLDTRASSLRSLENLSLTAV